MKAYAIMRGPFLRASDSDAAAPQQTHDCITTVCHSS